MDNQWVVRMVSSCGKHYYLGFDPSKSIRQQPFESYYQPLEGLTDLFRKFHSLEAAETFIKEYGGPWSGGQIAAIPFSEAKSNVDLISAARLHAEAQDALLKEDMKLNMGLLEITEKGSTKQISRRFNLNVPNE